MSAYPGPTRGANDVAQVNYVTKLDYALVVKAPKNSELIPHLIQRMVLEVNTV